MAKNSKGQKVSNKKYYKKSTKTTSSIKKKKNTKVTTSKAKKTYNKSTYNKKPKKLDNNVSIIVDESKESLNYNILEEPIITPEEEEDIVKYQSSNKIKTQFKDEDTNLEDTKFLVVDDIKEEEKKYIEETEPEPEEFVEETPIQEEFPTEEEKVIETEFEESVQEESLPEEEVVEIEEPSTEETQEVIEEEPIVEEEQFEEAKEEEKKIEATNIGPEELEKYVLHNTQELKVITDDSDIYNNEDVDLPDDVKVNTGNGSFIRFVITLVVLFLLIILCIYSIISFSMKYVDNNNVNNIAYHELSSVDYKVCDKNCIYTKQITSKNKSLKIDYSYEMQFDEKITYEANYTIVAELNILDSKNNNNIVATDKSIIMKKDVKNKETDELNISQQIELELSKYRDKLKDYNYNNKSNNIGQLEVVMYVDGINDKERVSSIDIPMGNGEIDTQEISYNAGDASIENTKVASNKVYLYLIIGSFVVLFASCIGVLFLLKSSNDTYE